MELISVGHYYWNVMRNLCEQVSIHSGTGFCNSLEENMRVGKVKQVVFVFI